MGNPLTPEALVRVYRMRPGPDLAKIKEELPRLKGVSPSCILVGHQGNSHIALSTEPRKWHHFVNTEVNNPRGSDGAKPAWIRYEAQRKGILRSIT